MPKKILILGSRPYARPEPAEVTYLINGSAAWTREFDFVGEVRHVVCVEALRKYLLLREKGKLADFKQIWLNGFFESIVHRTIAVDNTKVADVRELLKMLQYSTGYVEEINDAQKCGICHQVLSKKAPYGLRYMFSFGFWNSLFLSRRFMRSARNRYINRMPWDSYFMPSNGVFALLHAIHEFGRDADYCFKGISVSTDPYAYETRSRTVLKAEGRLRLHILADRAILAQLRGYRVVTDDPSVADVMGIACES